MKGDRIPLLWLKIFLNNVNSRDYMFKYCSGPFNKFDKYCCEWFLSHNSDDFEIRMLDDESNNYILVWYFFTI